MYFASNVLFKTTDGGKSWQTISPDLTRENPGVPASVGTLFSKGMRQTAWRHLRARSIVQESYHSLGWHR